ncbi:hypothetical protein [Nonomuraea recticatena]|jgi:hypothetical protein|uniref:Uncharacterized protein n=1 Tax=Nonomuraea recticatena TaxID=46178 RepID=A0ABN3TEB5_9ACTN
MGWNTTALFVHDRSVDDLVDSLADVVSCLKDDQQVTADQAWSFSPGDRVYIVETAGWAQMWDPDGWFAGNVKGWLDRGGLGALKGTQALAVQFSSVMSTYAFWLFDDGELVRHVCYENGEPSNILGGIVGEPLSIEDQVEFPSWGPDEDFLWSVIENVTGLTADINQQFNAYGLVWH